MKREPLSGDDAVEEVNQILRGESGAVVARLNSEEAAAGAVPGGAGPEAPPPQPQQAGRPEWSRLLPQPLWDYFSRLEFYEADVPARERLFRRGPGLLNSFRGRGGS